MDIKIDMWINEDEGVLSKWFVDDGAVVGQGDLIATVALEKAEFEIEAPTGGVLKIRVGADGVVGAGDVIASVLPSS